MQKKNSRHTEYSLKVQNGLQKIEHPFVVRKYMKY